MQEQITAVLCINFQSTRKKCKNIATLVETVCPDIILGTDTLTVEEEDLLLIFYLRYEFQIRCVYSSWDGRVVHAILGHFDLDFSGAYLLYYK